MVWTGRSAEKGPFRVRQHCVSALEAAEQVVGDLFVDWGNFDEAEGDNRGVAGLWGREAPFGASLLWLAVFAGDISDVFGPVGRVVGGIIEEGFDFLLVATEFMPLDWEEDERLPVAVGEQVIGRVVHGAEVGLGGQVFLLKEFVKLDSGGHFGDVDVPLRGVHVVGAPVVQVGVGPEADEPGWAPEAAAAVHWSGERVRLT